MKKSKLLAGLLSFAMLGSMVPSTMMTVSAQTLPDDDSYMYYEGFEEADNYLAGYDAKDYSETTYLDVDAEGNEVTKTRKNLYTSELVTLEDGNTVMRYTKKRDTSLAWSEYSGKSKSASTTTETTVTEGVSETEGTTTELVSFVEGSNRVIAETTITNGTTTKTNEDGTTEEVAAYTTTVKTTTYTYKENSSYAFFDAQQYGTNSNTQGAGAYTIESDSGYEIGYKVDPHLYNGYQNGGLGVNIRGAWNRCNQSIGYIKFNNGTVTNSETGMYVNSSNIDGFIDVFVKMSFGTIDKTAASNGTADVYITYTTTAGETVELSKTDVAIKTGDGSFYLDRFTGMAGSEWGNSYADSEENYFDIDDIYIKKAKEYTITLDAMSGAFAEDTTGLDAETGLVTITNQGSKLASSKIPTPTVEGGGFAYWCTDEELTNEFNPDDLSLADTDGDCQITLYAKYDVIYTVTFDVNGGDELETNTISTTIGKIAEEDIPTPTNGALKFVGWYKDDGTLFDGTNVDGNFTVYAKWSSYVVDVDFENDDYDTEWNLNAPSDGSAQRWFSEVVTLEDGNKAMKYYYDGADITKTSANTSIAVSYSRADAPLDRNTTYEAGYSIDFRNTVGRFNGIQAFKLQSYYSNNPNVDLGGLGDRTFGSTSTYNIGGTSVKNSEVDGFVDVRLTFCMNGDTQTDDNKATNGTFTRTVSYKKLDGTTVLVTDSGTFASKGAADVDAFQGIYLTDYYGSATEGSYFLMDDIYVKVAEEPVAVHFDTNVEGLEIADLTATNGIIAEVPTIEDTDSYAFHGWYLDEACTVPFKNAHIFEETTLYAKIVGDSTVTFMNGDEVHATATAQNGLVDMTAIADPTLEGSEFLGWNTMADGSGDYVDSTTVYDEDTTVYAIYKGIVTVTFNANGGVEADATVDTLTGETVDALATTPTRTGYHFLSWNTEADGSGDEFTTSSIVNANMTVYAIWQKAIEVTFDAGYEGAEEIPVVYASLAGIATIPAAPTRTGYIFDGWYVGEDEVTAETVFTEDTTVTGQWLAAWIISYDTGVSTITVADGYAAADTGVLDGDIPTPTRGGYTFTGWVTADGAAWDGTGVTGDMTVYATWAVDETKTWGTTSYMQTFEEGDETDQTPYAEKANDRWSGEVVEDANSNKVMKYTIDTATEVSAQTIMSTGFPQNESVSYNRITDGNAWYEYGVTLDLQNLSGSYTATLMQFATRYAGRQSYTATITNGVMSFTRSPAYVLHEAREYTNTAPFTIDLATVASPIEFKAFINLQMDRTINTTADVVVVISYTDINGEEIVLNDAYSFIRWASGTSINHSASYMKGITFAETAASAEAEGAYFTVDNLYFKAANTPSMVALDMGDSGIKVADALVTDGYVVDLPSENTYLADGYKIHGWYLDADLTMPFVQGEFTGSKLYADIDRYVFKQSFDNAADASKWMIADGKRWKSEIVTHPSGRSAMKYTVDTSIDADKKISVGYSSDDGFEQVLLDRNTTYEAGYSIDFTNYDGRFNGVSMFNISNKWTGVDLDGMGDTYWTNGKYKIDGVEIDTADVKDGFVDVKITFCLNGDTETSDNYTTNGTYTRTVVYTNLAGESVVNTTSGTFASRHANGNKVDCYGGFSMSEYSSTDGGYFYIDDIYIKAAEGLIPVHFVTNVDGITFPDTTASNGIVLTIPTIEDTSDYTFDGWFVDADCTIPFVNGSVLEETTLYAKISDCSGVTFYKTTKDFAAGTVYETKYTSTGTIELPEEPVNGAYKFLGWYVADENGEATDVAFDGTGVPDEGLVVVAAWDGTYYYEDFEGTTYDSIFDYDQNTMMWRWANGVETDENGNKYMNYMLMDNTVATGSSTPVVDADIGQTINPNAWYEFGFKYDVDTTAYFNNMFGLKLRSGYGEVTTLGNWSHSNGATTMTFTGGTDEAGVAKTVTIAQADVDGFVTVKYQFCLFANGEATYLDANVGEAVAYITYFNKTLGKQVNEAVYFHNFSAAQTNSGGLCSLKTYLMGISANEWQPNSTSAVNGDTIKIDDMYLIAQPDAKVVIFNSNGGTEVETVDADGNGVVTLPADPTKDGYAFAGWFMDEALTVPFTCENVFADITVYARWQVAPNVSKVNPNGTKAVAVNQEFVIDFDSELTASSVNKGTIQLLDADGNAFDPASYEVTYSIDATDRHSIVKVTLNANLDFDADYTLLVSKAVKNAAGEMAEDYSVDFTTRKMWLEAYDFVVTNKESGDEITAVENAGGKLINIKYFVDLATQN